MSDGGRRLEPSTVLGGRYRIDRVLGRGGMGAVYEATRIDLDRRVAIKVLDHAIDAPLDALVATEREARALAKLAHPHIVQIIDFSRGDDGPPFFVMELLDGESLDARLRRGGKIAPGTAALVMVQVLSALAAAHAADILHRDVKPANVFLTPTAAGFDFVKLLDFGIAGNLASHATASVRGAALTGTPSHMAPEQVRADRLDPRTDVWAAGVCLYEMLADALPFDGDNIGALLANICSETPRPLVDVDAGLAAIVARAMAKDPVARFRSAEEMRAAVARYAAVGAVPSRDLGGASRFLEGAITVPAFPEAGSTVTSDDGAPASPVLAASTPRDRDAYASTAPSGPRGETLASGSARTFEELAPPPALGWLPILNGAVALAFVGFVALMLAPRRAAPLSTASPGDAVCSFARIRTWGEGFVDLRVAANDQGLLLAGSTSAPTLRYATLGEVDEPFDDWQMTMYTESIEPNDRVIPCASAGRRLMAGGFRQRPATGTTGAKPWTTLARFDQPTGQMLAGSKLRIDTTEMNPLSLDCAAVDDLTVFASVSAFRGVGEANVYTDVFDQPRKEWRSETIDRPSLVRIDASHEGFGRLVINNRQPSIGFMDFHTLQAETGIASQQNADPREGDVAIVGGEVDAIWVEEMPRALAWRRFDRKLANLGRAVLARGDVFSPSLAHGKDGVALAWGQRTAEGVRIFVGQGTTARDAAQSAMPLDVGPSAQNVVVAASGARPWVAWLENGVAHASRLACGL